jgi:hypothetical protein
MNFAYFPKHETYSYKKLYKLFCMAVKHSFLLCRKGAVSLPAEKPSLDGMRRAEWYAMRHWEI